MSEFMEPEEARNSEQAYQDINPLDEPVNEKSYSQGSVGVDPSKLNTPIPEPNFTPPPIEDKGQQAKQEPFNPQMNNLSGKDKEMASSHVANMIMDGYELMHVLANNSLVFNEKKLRKLEMNGDIDLSIQIQYGTGVITLGEFITRFNENNKELLKVTPEFRAEVLPVLQRVLEKRGMGMTDEQYLMFLFAKDIGVKAIIAFGAMSEMRDLKNVMIEQTRVMKEAMRQGHNPFPHNPAPPPQETAQPYQPEQEYAAQPNMHTEPIVPPIFQEVITHEEREEEDDETDTDVPMTANDIVESMTNPDGYKAKKRRKPYKKRKAKQ